MLEAELSRAAAFRAQLRRFLSVTNAAAAQAGLTSQRYDPLLMLRSAGELRVTDLCELLQLKQSTVTELVTRSEPRGLSLVPRHTGTLAHGSGSNPVRLQVKACSDWHTAPAHECGFGHALRRVLN